MTQPSPVMRGALERFRVERDPILARLPPPDIEAELARLDDALAKAERDKAAWRLKAERRPGWWPVVVTTICLPTGVALGAAVTLAAKHMQMGDRDTGTLVLVGLAFFVIYLAATGRR